MSVAEAWGMRGGTSRVETEFRTTSGLIGHTIAFGRDPKEKPLEGFWRNYPVWWGVGVGVKISFRLLYRAQVGESEGDIREGLLYSW